MNRFYSCLMVAALLPAVKSNAIAEVRTETTIVQPATPLPLQVEAGAQLEWRKIPIRYVSPSIIAYWLDPERNEEPKEFVEADRLLMGPQTSVSAIPKSPDTPLNDSGVLPTDITTLATVESQNALVVEGTREGIAKLEKLIRFLDQPVKKVRVETRVITVRKDDLQSITKSGDGKALLVQSLGEDELQKIEELIGNQKARVLTAPAIVTFNNMPARISTSQPLAAKIEVQNANGQFRTLVETAKDEKTSDVALMSALNFTVTPTVNQDKTITVAIQLSRTIAVENSTGRSDTGRVLISTPAAIDSVVNIPEYGTLLMPGLPLAMFTGDVVSDEKTNALDNAKTQTVVLLSAYVVKKEQP